MTSKKGALAFALAFTLVVSGVPAAQAEPTATVTIKNFDYAPMALTVNAGTTVTWKNLDGEPHTVTSVDGAFRSPALDEGDSFSFTFAKPGTYRYVCSIHPQMMATVTVK